MRYRTRTLAGMVMAFTLSATLGVACSAGTGPGANAGGAGGSSNNAGGSGPGVTSSASGQGGDDPFVDASGPSSSSSGGIEPDAACTGASSTAEAQIQPADIILAVDTSGSMDDETAEVQANLNKFATIITNSGIDVHVVLISAANMCIPAPLGSGACNGGDEKLPAYRHVLKTVNSHDALDVIVNSYDDWKGMLRPNASKTFLVVSDDESDKSAASFTSELLAKDPTFQGFKFDAIVAPNDALACFGCGFGCAGCPNNKCCVVDVIICTSLGEAEGKIYKQLVQQTGGILGDLCAQDFDPVFADMATAVVQSTQVSCLYTIPAPDSGTIDPTLVNVAYTAGGSPKAQTILNVPGGAAACGPNGGWYYDDPVNPTTVTLCPATCKVVQSDPGAKIDVIFGCKTEEVPAK